MGNEYSKRIFDIRLHLKSSEFVLETSMGELPGFTITHFSRVVHELNSWYPEMRFGTSPRTIKYYLDSILVHGFIEEIPIDEQKIILKQKYKKRERFYRFRGAWKKDEMKEEKSEIHRIIIESEKLDVSAMVGKNIIKDERKNVVNWK